MYIGHLKKTYTTQKLSFIFIYLSLFRLFTVMKPDIEGAWWRDEGKELEQQEN